MKSSLPHRFLLASAAVGAVLSANAATYYWIYLQMQADCERTGKRIKQLERTRREVQKQVTNEERNWAAASSIRNMERLLSRHGIEMSWPEEGQIIRLAAADAR